MLTSWNNLNDYSGHPKALLLFLLVLIVFDVHPTELGISQIQWKCSNGKMYNISALIHTQKCVGIDCFQLKKKQTLNCKLS